MKHITVTVKVIEEPRHIDNGDFHGMFCCVDIPALWESKSMVTTNAELRTWSKGSTSKTQIALEKAVIGSKLLINDGELTINYNKETRTNEIQIKATQIAYVPENFPEINTVILTGRTMQEFDPNDQKQTN